MGEDSKMSYHPVTINIPPPPLPPEELKSQKDPPTKPELMGTLLPLTRVGGTPQTGDVRNGVNDPVIGDVKMTLDDLKSSVLSYYSQLYAAEGRSIDEKLDYIQQYHYPSVYPIGGLRQEQVDDLNRQTVDHKSSFKQAHRDTPSNIHVSKDSNFVGSLNRPRAEHDVKIPELPANLVNKGVEFGLPPSSRTHGISDLVTDLKAGVSDASQKLDNIATRLSNETDDPARRGFSYRNVPHYKRRPYFGGQTEMEDHMLQLYSDLFSQVKFNERKIRALRHRLDQMRISRRHEDPRRPG